MEKAPQIESNNQDPYQSEIDVIAEKVQRFSDIYDENDHNGMDQTTVARKAGYSDFDAYVEDAQLLYSVTQGEMTAEEAITARNNKIEAALEAKKRLGSSGSKRNRKLTSREHMFKDIADARTREMDRMRAKLEAEEAENSQDQQ